MRRIKAVLTAILTIAAMGLSVPAYGQQLAYVTDENAANIFVLDLVANQVAATIPVEGTASHIALTPDGHSLWVAYSGLNRVAIVDLSTNTITANIDLPASPQRVIISPNGKRAYLTTNLHAVLVFNAQNLNQIASIPGVSSNRVGMAFTPDARRLYISNDPQNSINILDVETNHIIGTIQLPPGNEPRGITFSPKGDRFYVVNALGSSVSVFSSLTNTLIATIPLASSSSYMAVAPSGARAYVADGGANTIETIDTVSNTVIGSMTVLQPWDIIVAQDGSRAYFSNDFDGTVSVLDLATNTIVNPIVTGGAPALFAIGKDLATISVGLTNSDDAGIRFDLRAEVYRNNTQLLGSGELTSISGGSSGFNNARTLSIPLDLAVPFAAVTADQISIRLLVRNACDGSGKNSGRARLWFNDTEADSRFSAMVAGQKVNFFLRDGSLLNVQPGYGPRKTIDVQVGAKCSEYKSFGTWQMVLP